MILDKARRHGDKFDVAKASEVIKELAEKEGVSIDTETKPLATGDPPLLTTPIRSQPRMQNIPIKSEDGDRIKEAFRQDGMQKVFEIDYGGLERRILAMAMAQLDEESHSMSDAERMRRLMEQGKVMIDPCTIDVETRIDEDNEDLLHVTVTADLKEVPDAED